MRALCLLLCAAAFDYKSISVNAPRRIVTQDDIDAKFEQVDKPYALYPVDGPAEEGLCVLAEISLDDEGSAALAEGVELTRKGFMDVLAKYGVETVDPQGEPFDPETAQAMSMVEQPDVEPNSVVAVMQRGYLLNGRLLRPAMVMVSKAPSGE